MILGSVRVMSWLLAFLVVLGLGRDGCAITLANPARPTIRPEVWTAKEWVDRNIPGLPIEVLNGAANEGRLMVYTLVTRENLREVREAFEKRFPFIKVEYYAASGGVLAQRFSTEVRAKRPIADVLTNTSPALADSLAAGGLLMRWMPPNDSAVPKLWKRSGYWYGVGLAHLGIAWNIQQVSPEEQGLLMSLKSWSELLRPEMKVFKGRTGMVHIKAGGSTQLFYAFFDWKLGSDSWAKLKATYEPVMFSGINPLTERLVVGEFSLVINAAADTGVAASWLRGAPVRWRFLEPGLAYPYLVGISPIAPHPNAAKLFVAWSLSPEGLSVWSTGVGLAPVRRGVKDNRPWAAEAWYRLPSTYYRPDWAAIEARLEELTKKFSDVFGQ